MAQKKYKEVTYIQMDISYYGDTVPKSVSEKAGMKKGTYHP